MNPRTLEATPRGNGLRIAVVASRFNAEIVRGLVDGALAELAACGVAEEDVQVVWVPGALEIPPVIRVLGDSGNWHGAVALGCVIRGETAHFEHVSREATAGIARIALEGTMAVGAGILTVEDPAQARVRAGLDPDEGGGKEGSDRHRGRAAARACVEMARLLERLRGGTG